MKELLTYIFNKYKKIIVLIIAGVSLISIGSISWEVYFVKIKTFSENEKKFSKAAKHYYEFHKQQLPKKGESRTLTLQDLYSKNLIEDLYIPKTKQTCDVNASRVRVYQNENGEYIYNSYLKCGKYESKVDHLGPVITLNGEDNIIVAINSEFKDEGIKEVVDDIDGKIDISKVKIDTSNLDMKKIGNYKVTYTVFDSSFNKTVLEKNVYVRSNLTDEVKKNTDNSGYYKGNIENNYIIFSGMLFRIVNVNNDGTIKIVSNENLADITYGKEDAKYENSNIKEWLEKVFYNSLNNPKDYVVEDSKWCVDETCTNTITAKVGLLTLNDYKNSLASDSYLSYNTEFYLMNQKADHTAYIVPSDKSVKPTEIHGVKPVLVLNSNLFILTGNGTSETPYKIGDYKQAKKNDLLNTRLVGEYVNYSGMLFRINGIDKSGNIRLITDATLQNELTQQIMFSNIPDDKVLVFDPDKNDSLGNQLNEVYIDYFDETLLVNQTCNVYKFDENKKYNQLEKYASYKVKICMPSSFDLFAGNNGGFAYNNYWFIDYVDDTHAFASGRNGSVEKLTKEEAGAKGAKIVIKLDKKSKIIKGNGTRTEPFYVK